MKDSSAVSHHQPDRASPHRSSLTADQRYLRAIPSNHSGGVFFHEFPQYLVWVGLTASGRSWSLLGFLQPGARPSRLSHPRTHSLASLVGRFESAASPRGCVM